MTKVTPQAVEQAIVEALPAQLRYTVDRRDLMIFVTLREQPGIPWDISVGWEGGEAEHLLWIFSEVLKYEEMSLEGIDQATLKEFSVFIHGIFHGELTVELCRFRSSGKLWRTRLLDPRRPETAGHPPLQSARVSLVAPDLNRVYTTR
ncbi:hypothetical protein GRI38_10820 [Altererythrobacter aurantiacus]|uniref:Uncharacterized protein n=1 Tax=Parapontixanthobacter aurantiacus TaxID=1463599 RepID=A0A844ZHU7_9SPHN|nr:hypothetical protein [Parapontixanthobacter aurantiacus]MXO86517.1 hypothetical protein [Parapontixanthobacter aurantiacus]